MRKEIFWDLQLVSHELLALYYELILCPMLICGTGCLFSFKRFSEIRPESPENGLIKRAKLYNYFLALLGSLNNVINNRAIQAPWICAFTLQIRCQNFRGIGVLLITTYEIGMLIINITRAGSNLLIFKIKSLNNSSLLAWRALLLILHHEVVLPAKCFRVLSLWQLEAYRAIEKCYRRLELRYSFCKFSN